MNDCANAGVRDRLPELLHDRLDAQARAAIMAHVTGCVDCAAELELLRDMRGMLAKQAPRIDVNWVAEALPKPPRRPASIAVPARPRRVWSDWRVAAAVTLLVAGGSSMVVLEHGHGVLDRLPADTVQLPTDAGPPPTRAPATAAASAATITRDSSHAAPAPSAVTTSRGAAPMSPGRANAGPGSQLASADEPSDPSLGAGGRLENLSSAQLKKLLSEIDQIDATPITDPDPVSLRVDSHTSSSKDEP